MNLETHNFKLPGQEAQGDLEDPFDEALEEEVGSLEGDFNSDFVQDLKVGMNADMLHSVKLTFSFLWLNNRYTNESASKQMSKNKYNIINE